MRGTQRVNHCDCNKINNKALFSLGIFYPGNAHACPGINTPMNVLNTISSVSICCYPAVLSTGASVDSFISPCWMGNFLFGLDLLLTSILVTYD